MEIVCGDKTILRINYVLSDKTEVVQSHTYSYLQGREMLKKDLGQVMGFDREDFSNGY